MGSRFATRDRVARLRVLARHALEHRRRFAVWWEPPRHLFTPRWWLWTRELAYVVAAVLVAERCAREGIIRLYPARLHI